MATAEKNLSEYDKEGLPDIKGYRFGIVVSEWNDEITENLCQGAIDVFTDLGPNKVDIIRWNVPGSYELVYGCKKLAESHKELDAIIAVGNVIQGETKHFDFICQAVTQGIKDLNIHGDIPIIFCVLTDNNIKQSRERSGGKHGNKGTEAAVAAIKMAELRKNA